MSAPYGTCDSHPAVHAFRNDPDPCIGWADEATTLHVATAEVRGYTVTAAGMTQAEAVQVLWRQLRASEHGRAVLALYADKAEWTEEVSTYTVTAGQAAWL